MPTTAMETPLLAEHHARGAQLEEFSGCLLPKSFAGSAEEYRSAREHVAIFDMNWQAIVTLAGRDRVKYLHAISSNNIKELAEGHGMPALLLTPQGRILAEVEVYTLPENLLALSHASVRERTVATLKKYILGSQVQLEDVTDKMGSIGIGGPGTASVVARISGLALSGFSEFSIAAATIEGAACFLLKRSHWGSEGAEIIAPRENLEELWKYLSALVYAAGGQPIGMEALNSLRLEAGVPWFPADFNDSVIPHEAVLENTHISFNKGCYTGQEIVERVRSRGHVNKTRVSLRFSTTEPPAPGTKLLSAGAEVGTITSSAYSPQAGTAIGMGYLRREALDKTVEFEGGTAKVFQNLGDS
jgi:folate-binding protein YgfZ